MRIFNPIASIVGLITGITARVKFRRKGDRDEYLVFRWERWEQTEECGWIHRPSITR